jgi:hypothetical protein
MIEPGAFLQALKEVDDGAEPEDVYGRYMSEAGDPEEITLQMLSEVESDHTKGCEQKISVNGYCPGVVCSRTRGGKDRRVMDCDCKCHGDFDL